MTTEPATTERPGDLERYDPSSIESKWQRRWAADELDGTEDVVEGRTNRYHLTMFPYTSGDLHVGHWFAMAPSDALARHYRMRGYNVMFPIGFDAFGLPAENAAIAGGVHPRDWTEANVEQMRGQLKTMGAMFDWDREVNTSHPDYYRWTQWWFLQLLKQDLAYRKFAPANWCPSCNTTLANEQVVNGACERCETPVETREMEQWFFRITRYADELLVYEDIDWPEHVKLMQRNWIGRSEGCDASFALDEPAGDGTDEIRVFTTRPDTLHGVTFMVLAPEHPLVAQITTDEQRAEVETYVEAARNATDIERQATSRPKTGVFTGAYCLNRLTGDRVPIWIADYALASYGTGAVMAVPAHDQRDFEFAAQFDLPVQVVIAPEDWGGEDLEEAYIDPGVLVNSGSFDSLAAEDGKAAITAHLQAQGWGGSSVQYRLRDWLISRQRYWGAPIPVVYCPDCGMVPVPEEQLPVELPYDVEFLPTGQSPLGLSEEFVNTTCPDCGKPARRETDTLDTFMCSSWYFLRYTDPGNAEYPMAAEPADAWLPVAQYTGGDEHAVLHLLYSRFFYKAARDIDIVPGDEPFLNYYSQGQILGTDGRRMSKSRGNVVAPDGQVERWGADTFRAYLMFLGPWDQGGPYDVDGIVGVARWLNRLWTAVEDPPELVASADSEATKGLRRAAHAANGKVSGDIAGKRFNTAIAALMELTNELQRARDSGQADEATWHATVERLLLLVAPICPHIAEELWERTGHGYSVHLQPWPEHDPTLTTADRVTIAVQVNGKVRDRIEVDADADEEAVRSAAEAAPRVAEQLEGREVVKVIHVPGRLLNLVVR